MKLKEQIHRFLEQGGVGVDPFAEIWRERRAAWSLFAKNLSDQEIELLRPYIFPYKHLPESPQDVLHVDDGVVDHFADGDGQASQHHRV